MAKTLTNGSGSSPSFCRLSATKGRPYIRFITPIFLHAGFVHILLNFFVQLSLSAQVSVIPLMHTTIAKPIPDRARDGVRRFFPYILRRGYIWVRPNYISYCGRLTCPLY